jgi:hypothetical protein
MNKHQNDTCLKRSKYMLKILITILDPLVIGYEFLSILGDLYDHFMCTSHILLSNYMMLLFKEIKL